MTTNTNAAEDERIPPRANPGADARIRKSLLLVRKADLVNKRTDELANVVAGIGDEGYVESLRRDIEAVDRELLDVADILQAITDRDAERARRAAILDHHATIERTRLALAEAVGLTHELDGVFDRVPALMSRIQERLDQAGDLGRLMPENSEVRLAFQRFDRLRELVADRATEAVGGTLPQLSRNIRLAMVVKDWTGRLIELANRTAPGVDE